MKRIKIDDLTSKDRFIIMEIGEFEFVNPVEKMREVIVNENINLDLELFFSNHGEFSDFGTLNNPHKILQETIITRAIESWNKHYTEIKETPFPENLLEVLKAKKKKDQIRLLKDISLTTNAMQSFIFTAWEKHEYVYSFYKAEHFPTEFDTPKFVFPEFAYKDERNKIISTGQTTLSDNQIKAVLDKRKVVVAKFLDKGSDWHCFFFTYNSLSGKEAGEIPHLHYISHAWGYTRKQAVDQLKSKRYNFPWTVHIPYNVRDNE